MKEIISIINQKGGVGKTTTAQVLADLLKDMGERVLLIDIDAQGNLSYSLKADMAGVVTPSIMNVLTQPSRIKKAIQVTERCNIIASSPNLATADTVITELGKEYKLKEALELIKDDYDYILIDTPPALNILTVNALTASTSCIITAQADVYSLQGILSLNNTINTIRHYCNKDLSIKGILLTRYNGRTTLSKDMAATLENITAQMNTKLFNTKIRECNAIREAQVKRVSLTTYAPKSNAVIDYRSLIEEL